MKNLMLLMGLMFITVTAMRPAHADGEWLPSLPSGCYGVWVEMELEVCMWEIGEDIATQNCYDITVRYCSGYYVSGAPTRVSIPVEQGAEVHSAVVAETVVSEQVSPDGEIYRVVIPAGTEAVIDEDGGQYLLDVEIEVEQ